MALHMDLVIDLALSVLSLMHYFYKRIEGQLLFA